MIQYKNYGESSRKILHLQKFRGVDFRSADTQVDESRSPDACNMMAGDNVYFPVKRPGYKRLFTDEFGGDPNGIFSYDEDGVSYLLAHIGTRLYRFVCENGEISQQELISAALNNAASDGFYLGGSFWLLDGRTFWLVTGSGLEAASEYAYVPMTSIAREPTGGGTVLEAVNLLTGQRCNSFAADGSARDFYLDAQDIDEDAVTALVNGVLMEEGSGFTVNRSVGRVTFDSAPAKFSGTDNVVITFSKTIPGYLDKINRCQFAQMYGGRNDTRVFFSGNPDEPNTDWYSGLYDPTYFPDTGYTKIGADSSAIMGYAKQYDSLIVIKDGKYADAAMYLRTCTFDESGEIMFPLQQGSAGDGCVSAASVAVFEDTPLYVSAQGLRAVVGTEVYEQRNIRSRSSYVDSRLTAQDLKSSCGCVHEGRYYLAVDGVCYVADLRQISTDASSFDGGAQFEWYYWDDIPAKRMLSHGGYLWMLGDGGVLYRFYRFEEKGIYHDDGRPVKAYWTTPLLKLDSNLEECTVRRVSLLLQPMQHSGCELEVESDGVGFDEGCALIDGRYLDLIDFDDVDFDRFSFSALYQPVWEHFNFRRRRTRLFALRIRSEGEGDGMGIYRILIDVRK